MQYNKSLFGRGNFIESVLPGLFAKMDDTFDLAIDRDSVGQVRYTLRFTYTEDPTKTTHIRVFTKLTATYGEQAMANGKPFVGVHCGG